MNKIFVPDPELRITFDEIKQHPVFKDFDFGVAMVDRVRGQAPWVPEEDLLEELADRDSQTGEPKMKKRGWGVPGMLRKSPGSGQAWRAGSAGIKLARAFLALPSRV